MRGPSWPGFAGLRLAASRPGGPGADGAAAQISAVVLAAGQSRRMGRPKMSLAWGESTVIGRVTSVLLSAGVDEVIVVTGGGSREVEEALKGSAARIVYNPDFAVAEMTRSLQTGLAACSPQSAAALVALGDQPQIEAGIVRAILAEFRNTPAALVVPSYRMRRGHPWVAARALWPELLALPSERTLRDFLNEKAAEIHYLTVDSPSVLMDLDTPEDYRKYHPPSA